MDFRFHHVKDRAILGVYIAGWNMENRPVVLDIETTGLDRFKDTIISAQLCVAGETTAYYIEKELIDELSQLTCPLVLHNFKFDFAFLLQAGIDLRQCVLLQPGGEGPLPSRRKVYDTMLMHHLLDENASHALDDIVQERWNDNYKEVFWSRNKSFQEAPLEEAIAYACRDVCYTGMLYRALSEELQRDGVHGALIEHVHKLALSLYDTEMRGVRVDLDYLVRVGEDLKATIDRCIPKMREQAAAEIEAVELSSWLQKIQNAQAKLKTDKGRDGAAARIKRPEFNWNSTPQMHQLVYGELGLPVQYKWDHKKRERRPTLNDDALEFLSHMHPMLATLREFRDADKVYGTFIVGTLERQIGGIIYPEFNVNGTVTGRISSSNPNMQNLPKKGGVRGIYIPSEGHKFISCDYGMLEVVIAAHYSQDPSLLRIIRDGASKHDITAAALGVPRDRAKTVNFAMQYLCQPRKVATILGISQAEGKHAWEKYWEAYAGEKKVVDECARKVDRGEAIVSLFGRRRRFPNVFPSDGAKASAYRQAYSSLIQGTGADCTHRAYYQVADYLGRSGYGRAVFEVHDEILIEVKDEHVAVAAEELQRIMINVGKEVGLSVPLTVDCSKPLSRWEK